MMRVPTEAAAAAAFAFRVFLHFPIDIISSSSTSRTCWCCRRRYRPPLAFLRRTYSAFGAHRKSFEMCSNEEQTLYEKAITRLNFLQSNAQTLALARNQQESRPEWKLQETREFLEMIGISLDDIDRLNVVHITGTKGKGSTAAFLESILRSFGYKTGFYSSPHLVHVRERIRIDGRPISKRTFTQQFSRVYDAIFEHQKEVQCMPAYFKFLTLLAFRIFCDERVDVAIVEVGIGGQYDCTNVVRRPVVCAINTLDLDHTKVLGDTLPEIAWNKAGIAKPGAVMLSVQQPPDAMRVIEKRCVERQCPLFIVPPLADYRWPPSAKQPELGIAGPHQHTNASMALQLARIWLLKCHRRHIETADANGTGMPESNNNNSSRNNCGTIAASVDEQLQLDATTAVEGRNRLSAFTLTPGVAHALAQCRWEGRSQLLRHGQNIVFHLDGAHTPQSMQFCAQWFVQSSSDVAAASSSDSVQRLLLFHCTGDRSSAQLLPNLSGCRFGMALFCPAVIDPPDRPSSLGRDSTNVKLDLNAELRRCEQDREIWRQIHPDQPSEVLTCVSDALAKVHALADNNTGTELHVLVTGSLHLVGDFLAVLDPSKANE